MGQDRDFASESYYRRPWRKLRERIRVEWDYRNDYLLAWALFCLTAGAGYYFGYRAARRRFRT